MESKFIFVTGGVYSSLGKGIAASSIGRILTELGFKVAMQKLDPYLNVDPGTMSPYQHGEVYVTADGAEADLDLGNYERFTNSELNKYATMTAGRIYYEVIQKERDGEYLGRTVQVMPHITNHIKSKLYALKESLKPDFVIVEIGGTVGDIESIPFIEAIHQFKREYGVGNVMFAHCTPLIPLATVIGELKTKPTQHSVKELKGLGITPDILLLRSPVIVDQQTKEKLSWSCDIDVKNIFCSPDLKSIYSLPKHFYDEGMAENIFKFFNLKLPKDKNLDSWIKFTKKVEAKKKHTIIVGLVGKYVELHDAYKSVSESLYLAGYETNCDVQIKWIKSQDLNVENYRIILDTVDAILVPGGFGPRGITGKTLAVQYARETKKPYLGICLGMQIAVIEFARNVLKLADANSYEFDEETKNPVFLILDGKFKDREMGGSLRLGNYDCQLKANSLAHKLYQKKLIKERHRHRYEFNNNYLKQFEAAGVVFSGINPESKLVEIMEITDHPYFIASQFHPEFTSRPSNPNPLFKGLVEATIKSKQGA